MEVVVESSRNRYSLFCPVCGADVLEQYLRDDDPCIHVVYIYFDAVAEFAYIAENHSVSFDERDAFIWSTVSLSELKEIQTELGKSVLDLVLHTAEDTIGALHGTLRIGFDFDAVDTFGTNS